MPAMQYILTRRVGGRPHEEDFQLATARRVEPRAGEVELETLYVSIDPVIRLWLTLKSTGLPPVDVGAPVRSFGLARVVASRHDDFAPGDIVRGLTGWRQRFVTSPNSWWEKLTPHPDIALEHYLGVLGMTGLTAWVGVQDVLEPKPGQTVLVSGASGAVGSVAVQLAKRSGARVIGIAGGPEKCALLTNELGVDVAVDRFASTRYDQLLAAAPDGIDAVFDNTGGPLFDASIALLNDHARIVLCGLISGFDHPKGPPPPANFGLLLTKRAGLHGIYARDHLHRSTEIEQEMLALVRSGTIKPVQSVHRGFDRLPQLLLKSIDDGPPGKMIVDVRRPA